MIDRAQNSSNTAERDGPLFEHLLRMETLFSSQIGDIYANYIRGIKIWQWQDYTGTIPTNLTITDFQNGSGLPFVSGYILDNSAVITRLSNVEKPPSATNNILTQWLPSNRVKVTTHTQYNVNLNQAPAQDCRLYFLALIPFGVDLPSGYQEAPDFVREERVDFLDSAYVNQYGDESIFGEKTFESQVFFTAASATRDNLGLGSAAVLDSEYFAAYHELTGASGALSDMITASDAGVSMVNGVSGLVTLTSPYATVGIDPSGQTIALSIRPQNTQIYRAAGQITGVGYTNNFARIIRSGEYITGVVFNNYTKKILYNLDMEITGVQII